MKRVISIIALVCLTVALSAQTFESKKKVITNDSIIAMGLTNGRPQVLIPAPGVDKSIIIQSIDVRAVVGDRLYSPERTGITYQIGYMNGSYWYQICTLPFEAFNSAGNSTTYFSPAIETRLWNESETSNSPVMIRFDAPCNFTLGSNTLILYITYKTLY